MGSSMKWKKSSRSGGVEQNCVEIGRVPESADIATRDSKDPEGPHLRFRANDWQRFITDVKSGRHDL
jgi:hypothetical protein